MKLTPEYTEARDYALEGMSPEQCWLAGMAFWELRRRCRRTAKHGGSFHFGINPRDRDLLGLLCRDHKLKCRAVLIESSQQRLVMKVWKGDD